MSKTKDDSLRKVFYVLSAVTVFLLVAPVLLLLASAFLLGSDSSTSLGLGYLAMLGLMGAAAFAIPTLILATMLKPSKASGAKQTNRAYGIIRTASICIVALYFVFFILPHILPLFR